MTCPINPVLAARKHDVAGLRAIWHLRASQIVIDCGSRLVEIAGVSDWAGEMFQIAVNALAVEAAKIGSRHGAESAIR
jgi:hypothetical protein